MGIEGLSELQQKKLRCNYNAFKANFGEVDIIKNPCRSGGLLIYYPPGSDSFIQSCENADYANGWLYGAVQGNIVRSRALIQEAEKGA